MDNLSISTLNVNKIGRVDNLDINKQLDKNKRMHKLGINRDKGVDNPDISK